MKTKAKRIKKVFTSSSQVYHLWANQSQSDARQGGRITRAFFKGESAYSYGHHYEVGRIVTYKGVRVGIVNNTGYSKTTSKHIHKAYTALNGLMPRLLATTFNVRDALLEVQGKLVDELMQHFNARKFWSDYDPFESKYGISKDLYAFNLTCKALKHPELQIEVSNEFKALSRDHVKKCLARQKELQSPEAEAKREAARLKRAERELIKNQVAIENWRAGAQANQFVRAMRPMLLRVNGTQVQTSSGAEVPLNEARELLRKLESGTAKPDTQIGSFTFNQIENGIVTIGCHRISLDEARTVLGKANHLKLVGAK